MRSISTATASSTGGRPTWWGYVHLLGDQATMPAQDRARCDQPLPPEYGRQPPDERGEHRSIRPIQTGLRIGSAQHGDFMPQHEKFDVLGRRRAPKQHQQIQKVEEDQVE
jgi:hypothetical protein